MRRLLWLLAFVPLGSCSVEQFNQNLDRHCDSSGCFSVSKLTANLDAALQPNVDGYAFLIGPIILPLGNSARGLARTSADAPERNWDASTPINFASIAKVLTTVGVLQSMKAHNLTLSTKIYTYLPPDWISGISNASTSQKVKDISFEDLLTHFAGFSTSTDTDYKSLKEQFQNGLTSDYHTKHVYANAHFAIFRIMLPYMEGFSDPGEPTRDQVTQQFYVQYMKQHVFQPVDITDAVTKPSNTPAAPVALSYPYPAGNTHGTDDGDWTAKCGGGGWVLSTADVYEVMISLLNDTKLLDDTNPQHLDKQTMNAKCLGWDCSVRSDGVGFVGKNGALVHVGGANTRLQTFAGLFKGVAVVVAFNSWWKGDVYPSHMTDIYEIVNEAYKNAMVP